MTSSSRFSRRQFVHGMGAGLALAALGSASAFATEKKDRQVPDGPRILTVIHLAGGVDAREIVAETGHDDYRRLRPTLALSPDDLLPLGNGWGLSRACAALLPLWQSGRIAHAPRIALPASAIGHYRATEIWHTGDPFDVRASGWLGRAAAWMDTHAQGVNCSHPSGRTPRIFRRDRTGALDARRDEELTAGRSWQVALGDLAESIGTSRGPELHFLTIPNFDTHWDQAAIRARLLPEMAQALERYQRVLDRRGWASRVMTLLFSEFGRTLAENDQGGTEHAAEAPVWLLGDRARLAEILPGAGVVGHSAPRDMLALQSTILQEWLRIPASAVLPTAPSTDPVQVSSSILSV